MDQFRQVIGQNNYDLRVAIPGIIQSFDPDTMTCTVQPAHTEQIVVQGGIESTPIKLITDVPVVFWRGGGFSITLPISEGDECLLIFADHGIDSWWQSGGTNNVQLDNRRHDLRDGFALVGPSSQQNLLDNISTSSLQLRSDDGTVLIDIADGVITVKAGTIKLSDGGTVEKLLMKGFLDWFQSTYMPSVVYVTTAPAVPSSGLLTTTVEGQ